MKRIALIAGTFMLSWAITGCEKDNMWTQAKAQRLGESAFFTDGQAAREPVAGAIALGSYSKDTLLHNGTESGKSANRFPFSITKDVLDRGENRYRIFCSQCHGGLGDGVGVVVQRGYRVPKPFANPETMKKSVGALYRTFKEGVPRNANSTPDVIAGTGYDLKDVVHPVFGRRLSPEDRWAIIAWIKVLQTSQHFSLSDLSPTEKQDLSRLDEGRSQNGDR